MDVNTLLKELVWLGRKFLAGVGWVAMVLYLAGVTGLACANQDCPGIGLLVLMVAGLIMVLFSICLRLAALEEKEEVNLSCSCETYRRSFTLRCCSRLQWLRGW